MTILKTHDAPMVRANAASGGPEIEISCTGLEHAQRLVERHLVQAVQDHVVVTEDVCEVLLLVVDRDVGPGVRRGDQGSYELPSCQPATTFLPCYQQVAVREPLKRGPRCRHLRGPLSDFSAAFDGNFAAPVVAVELCSSVAQSQPPFVRPNPPFAAFRWSATAVGHDNGSRVQSRSHP